MLFPQKGEGKGPTKGKSKTKQKFSSLLPAEGAGVLSAEPLSLERARAQPTEVGPAGDRSRGQSGWCRWYNQ